MILSSPVQPSTVPLPMSVAAGWPGGLSPMGYDWVILFCVSSS